ncbi:hypothetical protein AB0I98_27630 [Streptomyces sp. NPDC050211]
MKKHEKQLEQAPDAEPTVN